MIFGFMLFNKVYLLYWGHRYGVVFKFSEAPKVTRSMHIAAQDLALRHLWVIYPGQHSCPVDEKISVWPLQLISELPSQFT